MGRKYRCLSNEELELKTSTLAGKLLMEGLDQKEQKIYNALRAEQLRRRKKDFPLDYKVKGVSQKGRQSTLKRAWLFVKLYFYAVLKSTTHGRQEEPAGIRGEKLFMFFDPHYPARKHSVVAFVLPPDTGTEEFKDDLFGPFGYTSEIDLNGFHLYGRGTWGTIQDYQIPVNLVLQELTDKYPDNTIVLAGVRSIFGFHVWPLKASKFILVRK